MEYQLKLIKESTNIKPAYRKLLNKRIELLLAIKERNRKIINSVADTTESICYNNPMYQEIKDNDKKLNELNKLKYDTARKISNMSREDKKYAITNFGYTAYVCSKGV